MVKPASTEFRTLIVSSGSGHTRAIRRWSDGRLEVYRLEYGRWNRGDLERIEERDVELSQSSAHFNLRTSDGKLVTSIGGTVMNHRDANRLLQRAPLPWMQQDEADEADDEPYDDLREQRREVQAAHADVGVLPRGRL